ncbi:MAG: MqnA/MqnD/SBP family protein, partial [Bacteroidota bacterium]
MRKKLGVVPHVFAKPLVYGLGESGAKFELECADPATIAARMRERLLDVAFLSPIDYALHAPEYSIVPGIGVSSLSANRSLLLAFQEDLQKIQSVAVANASTSDVVAARIILEENYEVNPTFVPLRFSSSLTVEAMLTRA